MHYNVPGKFAMMRNIKENDNRDDLSRVGSQIRELINTREHGDGLLNGEEIEQLLSYYTCIDVPIESAEPLK
jgi:hypothetical protein